MRGIRGKVAIVTGGGQGIGEAEALRLASEGAAVAVFDKNGEQADQTVAKIRAVGGEGRGYAVDVADRMAVQKAVAGVADALGAPLLLVNNAGIIRDNLLFKMTDSDWDSVMSTHLKGSFLVSQAVQRYMVDARYGKIVNTSSTSALGNRGQANYAAAKAGIQGFTKTLAIELGPFNINVNAVAPGFIDTAMTRSTAERMGLDPEVLKSAAAGQIPLGRIGVPEDIAGVVAFLLSEDAAYVTGQVLYVRGGP
ncbi:MAG: 3-oxoacyl-ACP reductase FabG [Firmicutes bacterium]|nr:3-oxoacyl-ACP reductase FabG [Bacillota bacterium]